MPSHKKSVADLITVKTHSNSVGSYLFSSAGVVQKAVGDQVSARQDSCVHGGGQEKGGNVQTAGNDQLNDNLRKLEDDC